MTSANVISTWYRLINEHIRLHIAILCILICARQGSSTVVPIGSCILIYSEACPRSEIQFYLFTRNNPNNSELVYFSDVFDNVTSSSYNSSLPNKIIVHGYNADMNLDVLQNIKTAYLTRGDYNVWFVNWPDLCRGPCYVVAVYNLEQVGKCVAQMIDRLKKYMGSGEPDIHLIGFSLGAHVSAYTAKYLRPYKLPRITGLDPAMPMFSTRDRDNRLDTEDAKFVDVIHTSAFVQGQYARSGHIDFYMNGGIEQPGCWNSSNMFDCNHRRAPQYFAESINTDEGFWGWPCTGMLNYILDMCPMKNPTKLMGEECSESSRGFYIVPTKSSPPFARGPLKVPSSAPKSKSYSTTSTANSIPSTSREKKTKSDKNISSSRTGKSRKVEPKTFDKPRQDPVTSQRSFKEEVAASSNEISTPSIFKTTTFTSTILETNTVNSTVLETTTITSTTEDHTEEETIADEEVETESTDSRFINVGTEIEFLEDVAQTSTTAKTTTEKSKYRFIYKVPRPNKSTEASRQG